MLKMDTMKTDLEFQDINYESEGSPLGQPLGGDSYIDDEGDGFPTVDDKDKLLDEEQPKTDRGPVYSFWTFEYYQQFFDVDTDQVCSRLLSSMMPRPGSNFLESSIRPRPDLYGPVWISLTLIFSIAISGNLASYIQNIGHTDDIQWSYDFNKVSIASTVIMVYVFVVPVCVFGVMWYKGNPANYTLLETVCVYGYSMAIFVPISILWMIPYNFVQWTLVLTGMALSGSFLALTFWPGLNKLDNKIGVITLCVMLLLHASIAVGFMMYFFHVPTTTAATQTSLPAPLTTLPPKVPEGLQQDPNQGAAPPKKPDESPEGGGQPPDKPPDAPREPSPKVTRKASVDDMPPMKAGQIDGQHPANRDVNKLEKPADVKVVSGRAKVASPADIKSD